MFGWESRRGKLGCYFDIPGVRHPNDPNKLKVFKQGYEVADTKRNRAQYDSDIGQLARNLIDSKKWEELLKLFPDNKILRASLVAAEFLIGAETTVSQLLDLNLKHWAKKRFRSLEDYQRKLKPVREKWGQTLARELTTQMLEDWKLELEAEGFAAQTIKHRLIPLKLAYRLGIKAGLVTTAPIIENPEVDNVESEDAYFEDEEIEAVLPHLARHQQGVVKLGHRTGWRKSEILSRKKTDILNAPEGEFLFLDAEHSKNGERRWFPLNIPGIKDILEEQLAYVRDLETKTRTIQEWLFPRPVYRRGQLVGLYSRGDGKPPMEDFEKVWESAVEASGINTVDEHGQSRRRLFRHLRQTAITNLLYLGVPAKMVSDIVGHKTIKMTVGRYPQKRRRRMIEVGERVARTMAWAAASDSNVIVGNFKKGLSEGEERTSDARKSNDSAALAAGLTSDLRKSNDSSGLGGRALETSNMLPTSQFVGKRNRSHFANHQ